MRGRDEGRRLKARVTARMGAYSLGDTDTGDRGEVTRKVCPPPAASPADSGENTSRGDAATMWGGVLLLMTAALSKLFMAAGNTSRTADDETEVSSSCCHC